MSTNVELPDQHAPVAAGPHQFGTRPAWLQAAAQPEHVQSALARSIPAFAAGELELEACEIRRLRFRAKTRCWTGSYRLTVAGPQPGQRRVVVLRGTIVPPGMDAPAAASAAPAFGEQGWRIYLPDLCLDLQSEQPLHDLVPPCLSGRTAGPGTVERRMTQHDPAARLSLPDLPDSSSQELPPPRAVCHARRDGRQPGRGGARGQRMTRQLVISSGGTHGQ